MLEKKDKKAVHFGDENSDGSNTAKSSAKQEEEEDDLFDSEFKVKLRTDDSIPFRSRLASFGYVKNAFEGKFKQRDEVVKHLNANGFIPKELIQNEVDWFYNNLDINDKYFATESVEVIAGHVLSLYGSKIMSFSSGCKNLDINLEREHENGAVFMHNSEPGISQVYGPQIEQKIDRKYLDISNKECAYRMESFRSTGEVENFPVHLRCYFITKCDFSNNKEIVYKQDGSVDIRSICDKGFTERASENSLKIYERIINQVIKRSGPVIEHTTGTTLTQRRLIVGFEHQSTQFLFSSLSDLYHSYKLSSSRKYVEHFSNGVCVMSIYLNEMDPKHPIEDSMKQISREISLLFCLPNSPFQNLFKEGKLSVQEMNYAQSGLVFAQHFLNRLGLNYVLLLGPEYVAISSILDKSNSAYSAILSTLKKRLRQDTFTRQYVFDTINLYPELVRILYVDFAMVHYTQLSSCPMQPTMSLKRISVCQVLTKDEILDRIRRTVSNNYEFMPTKVALSFRLDPSFLPESEYPTKLFGMFLVIGAEFRGFHLRFRDIARGGIRIIQSRNLEAYSSNFRSLFDENYSLASTQQRKNKDIPEGGSKGTILMDLGCGSKAKVAFCKYVDSILDLLLDGQTPGIKEKLVDLYGKPEILFFGPDEGTADFMDWASLHARQRGMKYWKAFTTGKSQSLGGIPHDVYGMTTRSVHQYVLGIYRKLGLKEEEMTKIQTGGPDGDLGSNEIKISKDITIAIIDGSGVLYDLGGLDRKELLRLANERKPICNFDISKLSPKGFRVLVEDVDVALFDGHVVESGFVFRNEFHLSEYATADLFVPCGGRPESVNISNVHLLLNENGKGKFRFIVEGANLFFTQEARLALEKAGVIIFKDAAANKGGVTSSSLEVLAALAFDDTEFQQNMQILGSEIPQFYKDYVEVVQQIIEHNAEMEFECLWNDSMARNIPKSILSDELSLSIIKLNEELQHTSLWENEYIKKAIITEATPKLILDKLGLDIFMERIPENYLKAIFGGFLASRFVYKYGSTPSQFSFFEFMNKYMSI